MKLKVTFSFLEGEDTTVTVKVPQDTIAELLKEYCFSDITDKASDKTGGLTRYGYIVKIEDLDV